MEYNSFPLCTEKELKWLYKMFNKNKFGTSVRFLMKRDVFVVTEGKNLFTNSCQMKGAYFFTDFERGKAFLKNEKNRTMNTILTRMPFIDVCRHAMSIGLDIYINLTPYGDKTLFICYSDADDLWYPGCKDLDFHFTLPYGIKPKYTKDGKLKKVPKNE